MACVVWKAYRADEELISYRWLELGHPNLASFDAWHLTFDEEHRRSLELSAAAIEVYNNPRFLPTSMCRRHRRSDIRARAICSNDKLGTIMAAYSQQHNLSVHLAEAQGIFTALVFEARHTRGKPHFLSPHQVLVAHAPVLPSELCEAFKQVGNFIAPLHALYVLSVAVARHARRVLRNAAVDPMEHISSFLSQRVKARTSQVVTRGQWSHLVVNTVQPEVSPTLPTEATWVANITTETLHSHLVLHDPATVGRILETFGTPSHDHDVWVKRLRGSRQASLFWEVRECCTLHVVSHSLARHGESRIAELRTMLHEVLPTTSHGHPSCFIMWSWDDNLFHTQRVPQDAAMLVLDYARELQQMIHAAGDPVCAVLQTEGWVQVFAPYENVDQTPQLAIKINLMPSIGPEPSHVELWIKWPGLSKARLIQVPANCELSDACRNAHAPPHVRLGEVEPWVNGHQIAWNTKAYHLASVVVVLRQQGIRGGGRSKTLSTRCATILLQQGVPVHKIAQKVEDLLTKCEDSDVASLETEPSMTKQKQSLVDLAAKHGVDLYQEAKSSGKGAGKSRRTSKRPPKKPVGPPPS